MGQLRASDRRLRDAVLCIAPQDQPGGVSGTGFAIAPGLVLTCAHVVKAIADRALAVSDRDTFISEATVLETAPNPSRCDLALLRADVPADKILPCWCGAPTGRDLQSRGYAPVEGAMGRGGRLLRFTGRGQVLSSYHGPGGGYWVEAFELAEDAAEYGFSGAPLLDVASGSVIGVVSGGLELPSRSWAVPLEGADADWPALAEALDWNDAHVPRFGKAVNAAGAVEACALLNRATIARMGAISKFIPARHVDRPEMPHAVRTFMRSEAPVLAIVGGSNTGKTWQMCDLARRDDLAPSLLILAGDLALNDPPLLADFASGILQSGWPDGLDVPEAPGVHQMAEAVQRGGRRLLLLLDGVNEAMGSRNFLKGWLPDAVTWAHQTGAKLAMTSRPEPWPSLLRAIPNPLGTLCSLSGGDEEVNQRHLRVDDFSAAEAAEAARRYALPARLGEILGRHPLMFRLAADLGLDVVNPDLGRYRLIDAFVDLHLDEVATRLRLASIRTLRLRLGDVAASLPADGSGSLDLAQASRALGSDDLLDAILASGLLIGASVGSGQRMDAIRFVFDQIGEALAPAPPSGAGLFAPAKTGTVHALRRSAAQLLRLEANGNDAAFAEGLLSLTTFLRQRTGLELQAGEAAANIATALPPARSAAVEAIYVSLAGLATPLVEDRSFSFLVNWLGRAPLPPPKRAKLLLSVAPWSDAYPNRTKDWATPDPSSPFERDVRLAQTAGEGLDASFGMTVAAALAGLLRDHGAAVRPLLVAALDDTRRIDQGQSNDSRGEASVASLAGGVLFQRRQDDLAAAIDAGLREGAGAGSLRAALAEAEPSAVLRQATSSLEDPFRRLHAAVAIGMLARADLDPTERDLARTALEPYLAESGIFSIAVARALLRLKPGHFAAWDRVADAFAAGAATGSDLHPVASERFESALAHARARPAAGLVWATLHDGPLPEQRCLADWAATLLSQGMACWEIGWLVESKVTAYLLGRSGYEAWLPLAEMVAEGSNRPVRAHLIYALFVCLTVERHGAVAKLMSRLAEEPLDEAEIDMIADQLAGASAITPQWLHLFYAVRNRDRGAVDKTMALRFSTRSGQITTQYLQMLGAWPDDRHSCLSRALVATVQPQTVVPRFPDTSTVLELVRACQAASSGLTPETNSFES